VFIGANIDAFATGTALGVAQTAQYTASSEGTQHVYAMASRGIARVRNRTVKYGENILDSETLEVKKDDTK
jgi:membrane-bound ClpP family serine protease